MWKFNTEVIAICIPSLCSRWLWAHIWFYISKMLTSHESSQCCFCWKHKYMYTQCTKLQCTQIGVLNVNLVYDKSDIDKFSVPKRCSCRARVFAQFSQLCTCTFLHRVGLTPLNILSTLRLHWLQFGHIFRWWDYVWLAKSGGECQKTK